MLLLSGIALLVQHGVDDRVVGVDHQGTLSLLLLQSGKIVLCLLRLASLQHPGKGRDVMPKIVRHFALCGVGAAQGINVGTLGAQLLVKRFLLLLREVVFFCQIYQNQNHSIGCQQNST